MVFPLKAFNSKLFRRFQIDQLKKIYDLCGSPDENNWPGVSEMPLYKRFEPSLPLKRRLIETYGQ